MSLPIALAYLRTVLIYILRSIKSTHPRKQSYVTPLLVPWQVHSRKLFPLTKPPLGESSQRGSTLPRCLKLGFLWSQRSQHADSCPIAASKGVREDGSRRALLPRRRHSMSRVPAMAVHRPDPPSPGGGGWKLPSLSSAQGYAAC